MHPGLEATRADALYADLVERGIAQLNPVRNLPRATRRLYKRQGDSTTTPFLKADLAPNSGFADTANRGAENGAIGYAVVTRQEARPVQAV